MKRGGEIRRTPTRYRARNTGPSAEMVALIAERDRGCCAVCGGLVGGDRGLSWSVQHRLRRGNGGTRRLWINWPSNLILACGSATTFCHGRIERWRTWAQEQGYRVEDGVTLPAQTPIEHAVHGRVYLTDDGVVSDEPPEVAA